MSEYVSICSTSKGGVDATVAKSNVGVASHKSLEAAAIQILCLCHVACLGTLYAAHEIDMGAVISVIGVAACHLLAYGALLTATIDVEVVAVLDIDGGGTPYLGVLTIAAAEDAHRGEEKLVTLYRGVNA